MSIERLVQFLGVIFPGSGPGDALLLLPGPASRSGGERREIKIHDLEDRAQVGGWHARVLPYSEAALEEIQTLLTPSVPQPLHLIPPIVHFRELQPEFREHHPHLDLQQILLERVIDFLPDRGRVAVTLPLSELHLSRTQGFFTRIRSAANLQLVVTHEHPMQQMGLNVSAMFRMATLLFAKQGTEPGPLRFFKIPEIAEATAFDEALSDLTRLLRQGGGKTKYGYVLRDGLPPSSPPLHDLYDPDRIRRRGEVAALGGTGTLADFFDVVRGVNTTLDANRFSDSASEGGVPVIEGRCIDADGRIDDDAFRFWMSTPEPRQLLAPGDFCIPSIRSSHSRLRVAFVTESNLPATAAQSVMVLRPKPGCDPYQRAVLAAYLSSDRAAELLSAVLPSGIHLPAKHLLELPVPVLDEPLRAAFEGIDGAIRSFQEWTRQAEGARNSLFTFASPVEARMALLAMGRSVTQRRLAAELVDDPKHRIRTRYPHPIAFRWRTVESAHPDLEGYVQLLECFEATMTFLAVMAMTYARAIGTHVAYVGELSKRFAGKSGHGTSLGDWIAILREVNQSKAFKPSNDHVDLAEVATLLGDEEVDQAVQRLSDLRNDHAHGRGPKGVGIRTKFVDGLEDLMTILEAASFLADYPLRFLEDVRRDTLTKTTFYQARDLMGDHPLVPMVAGQCQIAELEQESLYLIGRSGIPHLIRPLLNLYTCPECGTLSTFFLDRFDRKTEEVLLKSLEHGHTLSDKSLVPAFRSIGLLA